MLFLIGGRYYLSKRAFSFVFAIIIGECKFVQHYTPYYVTPYKAQKLVDYHHNYDFYNSELQFQSFSKFNPNYVFSKEHFSPKITSIISSNFLFASSKPQKSSSLSFTHRTLYFFRNISFLIFLFRIKSCIE